MVEDDFPPGPEAADGWLITGSKHGAYEDHPWIPPLEQLMRDIRDSGRPLIGVCFGHQIIAQALGGKVEKFTRRLGRGPHDYQFTGGPKTTERLAPGPGRRSCPRAPGPSRRTEFCENAALLYDDRIFTVQPHPEFDDAFIEALIDKRGPGVVPDALLEGGARQARNAERPRGDLATSSSGSSRKGSLT